jgi:hypothetical protein
MIPSRLPISFCQRRCFQGGGLYGRRPLMWWKRLVVFMSGDRVPNVLPNITYSMYLRKFLIIR